MRNKLLFFTLFIATLMHAQIPTNGLVTKYDFNSNLHDEIGNANLTGTNSPAQFITDRFGKANSALNVFGRKLQGYTFTGANNELSISFWMISGSSIFGERIFQIYDTNGDGLKLEADKPNLSIGVDFKNDEISNANSEILITSYPLNWTNITIIIKKTTSGDYDNSLYINGILNNTISSGIDSSNTTDFLTSNAQFTISPISGGNGSFGGSIDDVLIYNRALTPQEITNINNYNPQKTLITTATNGTITTSPLPNNGTLDEGTVVTLTAVPDTGYEFKFWTGHLSGTANPTTVTMDGNKSITATFDRIPRRLNLNGINGSIGTDPITFGNTYLNGDQVILTAVPGAGYKFSSWSGDVNVIGTPNPIAVIMDSDKNITANFTKIRRQLILNPVNRNGTITANPTSADGFYDDGTSIILTATPNSGYSFIDWNITNLTANTQSNSAINPITFILNDQYRFSANFSTTASIFDANKIDFEIYPNPTNSMVNLKLDGIIKQVVIFNAIGQKVKTFTSKSIDISSLENGIYLLKIETTNGKIGIQKILKN